MTEEKQGLGLFKSRIAAWPSWAKLVSVAALLGVIVLVSKWLILLLLVALGLWPILVLLGLGILGVVSTRHGGWPWMKEWLGTKLKPLVLPALAVLAALILGGFVIMLTDNAAYQAIGAGQVGKGIGLAFKNLVRAYVALYQGALGSPARILSAIFRAIGGEGLKPIMGAVRGPSDSLVQSVPYIFAGLAVALGFRSGLFNIGAEGQIGVGWLVSVIVGFSFPSLPGIILLPMAIITGALAAGIWGALAGLLKAETGAHEVITTIMFNYISFRLSEWILCGPLENVQGTCRTKDVVPAAYLPKFLDHPVTMHWGFILALLAAAATAWLLFKTTWGYEMRTVGTNPDAARYGGMNVSRTYVLAMFLSGLLAGLAGVSQGLGLTHNIALGFSAGYGFDAIALALLGKSNPVGVVGASILFGVLRAGAARMQSLAGIPTEIVQIVQSLVIVFIAAPAIIKAVYRLKDDGDESRQTVFSRGWGS